MRKATKYLAIGALVVGAFMFWVFGDDSTETIDNMNQSAGAHDESDYYTLTLDDESEVDILVPYCISSGRVKNLRDEREHDIFASIYAYDHDDDVYLSDIPDDDLTVRELLEAPYAVGTLFNFSLNVLNTDGAGQIVGELQGCDDSIGDLVTVDSTYLDDTDSLSEGDIMSFDAVYAGLDTTSDPLFIGLDME